MSEYLNDFTRKKKKKQLRYTGKNRNSTTEKWRSLGAKLNSDGPHLLLACKLVCTSPEAGASLLVGPLLPFLCK